MVYLSTIASATLLATVVSGAAIGRYADRYAGQAQGCPSGTAAKAVYFLTNDAASNAVVALPIAADGTLKDGSITPTGGKGSAEVDAKTKKPNFPDSLSSQSSLRVVGHHLFAVNAGSNTLTMMAIDPADPTKLTVLGEPANTGGDFPVSVTASKKNSIACVANTGAKAGVSCAKFSHAGLCAMDGLRPFNLNQSNPPTGPFNTVAQTLFNEDETVLLTTVKGDPAVNNTGFLSAFAVSYDGVSYVDTQSSPSGTAVLFGTVPIPGTTNLLATDASFGAAILAVGSTDTATVKVATPIKGQAATCWAAVSAATGSGFVTDVGVNHLVELDTSSGAIIKTYNLTNGNLGMIDLVPGGDFLYALSPNNGSVPSSVSVFDLSGGKGTAKNIQTFQPQGVTVTAQGMTVLV